MRISLNNDCTVILTEYGVKVLQKADVIDSWKQLKAGDTLTLQMWKMIQLFGPHFQFDPISMLVQLETAYVVGLSKLAEGWQDEARRFEAKYREAQAELAALRAATRKDVWYWQNDGEDNPDSLICPVVMQADTLRELLCRTEEQRKALAAFPKMFEVLVKIEKWFGIFPETGQTWEDGSPVSYVAARGSNGERDYVRELAREALRHA